MKKMSFFNHLFENREVVKNILIWGIPLCIVCLFLIGFAYIRSLSKTSLTTLTRTSKQVTTEVPPVNPPPSHLPTIEPTPDPAFQQGPYACPAGPNFCKQNAVFKPGQVQGVLPQNSQLLAAFEGEVDYSEASYATSEGKVSYVIVTLTNNTRFLQALYYYQGTIGTKSYVREGESIGTVNGQVLPFESDAVFIFKLLKPDAIGKVNMVSLQLSDFK